MRHLDDARRRAGLMWVAVGLVLEVALAVTRGVRPGAVTVVLCSVVLVLALVVTAGAPGSTVVAARWAAAVALALDFAGAVADRFGAFGRPGQPGVSWGSWSAFVDATQELLLGVARPVAQVAAVLATGAEVTLAVLLLTGHQRRWVGKATAGLLVVYLAGMAASTGLSSIAVYAVPVLVGGALLVSACPPQGPAPAGRAASARVQLHGRRLQHARRHRPWSSARALTEARAPSRWR